MYIYEYNNILSYNCHTSNIPSNIMMYVYVYNDI